jgi:hypothetical protein
VQTLLSLIGADATVEADVEAPFLADGVWWQSIEIDGEAFDVSWRPGAGFGLYLKSPDFGGRPDEICTDASRCARRLLQIGAARRVGDNRCTPGLRDLRQLYAVSQVELAAAMGVDQAFVSRLERRADVKLSAVRQYVTALGGQLELGVRFTDYAAAIAVSLELENGDAA